MLNKLLNNLKFNLNNAYLNINLKNNKIIFLIITLLFLVVWLNTNINAAWAVNIPITDKVKTISVEANACTKLKNQCEEWPWNSISCQEYQYCINQ